MASYLQVSNSGLEPLTLDEAKLHLRVDSDEEDTLIYALIVAARQAVENYTWLNLNEAVYNMFFDATEVDEFIRINKQVITITSVQYKDATGVYQALSPSSYQTDLYSNPCRIKIDTKPTVGNFLNAWKIVFTAGFTSPELVPEQIKSAMKLTIGHLYEHREDVTMSSNYALENGAKYLVTPYKLPTYFI